MNKMEDEFAFSAGAWLQRTAFETTTTMPSQSQKIQLSVVFF